MTNVIPFKSSGVFLEEVAIASSSRGGTLEVKVEWGEDDTPVWEITAHLPQGRMVSVESTFPKAVISLHRVLLKDV